MKRLLFRAAAAALLAWSTQPAGADPLPSISSKVQGLTKRPGMLTLYLDEARGKVFLELPKPGARGEVGSYLYVEGIVSGLGSNPVGLDRGQMGDARLVTLRQQGGKALLELPNLRFRALTADPQERRAVEESFARSVLWAGDLIAETDGRTLVDFTSFLLRDVHDIGTRMRMAGQGSYAFDAGRSAVDPAQCLSFPENLELESSLTYTSGEPGPLVRETAALGNAATFTQHQSLLRLPDDGYRPRAYDPRSGSYDVSFADFAAPLGAPIERRYLVRHRLEKVDPAAARSRVKKPIVFYIDGAAPEPVRSALLEGTSWWKEAFDKAGFIDAFQVQVLPPDVHPLDARYSVVHWVHRSTRGWSYGGGVTDPRTGELVKGDVTLGSLRIRQDRLIFEGLAGVDKTGSGAPDDPVQLSLARIRQLAAHEVGHALGLTHNFAASTYGRASVMDYPAPLVEVGKDGNLDFSHAYAVGLGEWDIEAIRYAYTQFPPGTDEKTEAAGLAAIVDDNIAKKRLFVGDEDARPASSAQPLGNLWDNGASPIDGLENTLAVRKIALARFGEHNIAPGRPLSLLQEVLVPLYFHHRYQIEGAVKEIGGLDYGYALRGDALGGAKPIDAATQRRALKAVLKTISPEVLDIPEPVLALLLPRPLGYNARNAEVFNGGASPAFDPLAAAASAADLTVSALLVPERATRAIDQNRRDPSLPGLDFVLTSLVDAAFTAPAGESARHAEIRRVVQDVVTHRLISLSQNPAASGGVRARAEAALLALKGRLANTQDPYRAFLAREVTRSFERPREAAPRVAIPEAPPGMPIGSLGDAPELWGGCAEEGRWGAPGAGGLER